MKSPLNYLGGKSKLVKVIVPMIPKDHICYCEPFCGAVGTRSNHRSELLIHNLCKASELRWKILNPLR